MTKIGNKQKEAISEIYLMCTVSTDIRYKLSFLTQLYAAIRSALLAAGIVEIKQVEKEIKLKTGKDNEESTLKLKTSAKKEKLCSTDKDEFDSAKLLSESKNLLYDAYSAYADRNNWIGAEQTIIEIIERLSALGYMHEFIDIEPERWNASHYMISPSGNNNTEDL